VYLLQNNLIKEKQLILFRIPDMTAKQYGQCWDELRAAGMQNPPGLIHHVGAQQGAGLVVADVWESLDAFNKFGETLMPIFAKLGVAQATPEILPVHNEVFGLVEV
jgi:hypothetical protein